MRAFARFAVDVYISAVPVCDPLSAGALDRYSLGFGSLLNEIVGILTHAVVLSAPPC